MVNSSRKGKGWERHFAKLLTKLTGKQWHRTASSGAMATAQGIQDNRFKGDLFCEDYSDVVVEVKSYKTNIRLEDIANNKSILWKWINQCEREAEGKRWVLLFHTNRGGDWIVWRSTELGLPISMLRPPQFRLTLYIDSENMYTIIPAPEMDI